MRRDRKWSEFELRHGIGREEWSMVVPPRNIQLNTEEKFHSIRRYYIYERYLLYCSILVEKLDNKFNGKSGRMEGKCQIPIVGYPWSGKINRNFLLSSFATHFYSYSSDVPTSKFGISIPKNGILYRILKISWASWCALCVRHRVVYISMNYLECYAKEVN